jgi:hypothetical protein
VAESPSGQIGRRQRAVIEENSIFSADLGSVALFTGRMSHFANQHP